MKRSFKLFISVCTVLIFALLLSACGGAASPTLTEIPWAQKDKTTGETAVYQFNRYLTSEDFLSDYATLDDSEEKGYKLNETGTVTYTLSEGFTLSPTTEAPNALTPTKIDALQTINQNYTLIKMELTITYKSDLSHLSEGRTGAALSRTDVVSNVYAGKTDKVISYSVIDRYDLSSVFTYKWSDIQTQADIDTLSYTLISDYTGEYLGSAKAVLTDNSGTRSVKIKGGTYYDAESVYFRVRALESLEKGGSMTFKSTLPYDAILQKNKKLKAVSMQQKTGSDFTKLSVPESIYKIFNIPASTNTEEDNDTTETPEFMLDTYKTELSLTSKKSGPPINLYYSAYPVKTNTDAGIYNPSSKVLLKMDYLNYDTLTNSVYSQEYNLSSKYFTRVFSNN